MNSRSRKRCLQIRSLESSVYEGLSLDSSLNIFFFRRMIDEDMLRPRTLIDSSVCSSNYEPIGVGDTEMLWLEEKILAEYRISAFP